MLRSGHTGACGIQRLVPEMWHQLEQCLFPIAYLPPWN
jgi:hypothetical protein